MLNLEDYRVLFTGVSLIFLLMTSFPGLSVIVSFPKDEESFSELWLLGPERMAEGYPFNVQTGAIQGPVYVGVGNHMGRSEHYMVCAKLRNQTQPIPNATTSEPSSLPPLYEFQFFLAEGETWEAPVAFIIEHASFETNSSLVASLSINDHVFPVDLSSSWDSHQNGFYYQLFFELWLYGPDLQEFQFHDRFVGIWLNMTG